MGRQPSYRVVAHEARPRRHTGIILSSRPHYRTLTKQLLGDLPQGPGSQVEHELFGTVADVEAVAVASEIGIAADFGPLRVERGAFFLGERPPSGGIVPLHAGQVGCNRGPHCVSGTAAEFGVEHGREHEEAVALELGYLVCRQERDLLYGWGDWRWLHIKFTMFPCFQM